MHEVVIACGSEVIARHQRSYEREDMIFDPLHYLALLEQKTRALDQAAPLAGWQLPECFAASAAAAGSAAEASTAAASMCRCCGCWRPSLSQKSSQAIEDALRLGTISFDAVEHLLLCRIERQTAAAGSGELSAPAAGPSAHHAGRRLHDPAGVEVCA